MTSLRRAIIFIVVFLSVFFNIERLDYSEQTIVDLHTFVYVLVFVIILSILFLPFIKNLSNAIGLVIGLGVYLILKLALFTSRPFIGGVYTYLSITEMAMIALSVLFTLNLSRALSDFEGIAANMIFPKRNQRVIGLDEAEENIKTEFIRSRRHHRPLSVMVVEMDRNSIKKNAAESFLRFQQLMVSRFMLASLGQVLTKVVRRTDLIIEPDEQDEFVILCPETTEDGANLLASRIQTMVQEDLGLDVRCGFSAFPEEAISFDDLLKKARIDMLKVGERSNVPTNEPSIAGPSKE